MILINSNKLIDTLLTHKRFYTRAYRCFSEMPKDLKARYDEIDNCIAEIVNLQHNKEDHRDELQVPDEWQTEKFDASYFSYTEPKIVYICRNCNGITDDAYKYCPHCGKAKTKKEIKDL